MKINPLLNELARGLWYMSFEGLQTWGPVAHKIMNGEKFTLNGGNAEAEPRSLVTYMSDSGSRIIPDAEETIPPGTIAVVDMIGAIIKYGDWCTYGADEIVGVLKANDANPNIIAQILNIDGPGGAVSAVAPFVEFGLTKKKPVIGLVDLCCSAHLYAAVTCTDHIMASNDISATIGSIGVVLSWVENRKYLTDTFGYNFHEVYPAESADKNKAFSLAMEGKYDMIKNEMLSPMAIKFQDTVKAHRPNLKANEPGVLTGKTFSADKALGLGLIDSIGSMQQAINLATMMSEMKSLYKS
jgi:protease-4